jgi:phosphatidylethanolamine/phosphatidyl-N-methylethanolamine N-methyltransferase
MQRRQLNTNRLNIFRYTLYAPAYDWAASVLEHSRKHSLNQLQVKKGDKVLIVGAGTGMDLNYLPVGCELVATDITPAMVRRIMKKNEQLHHQLQAIVMDGQQLAFPDEHFDKIILHLILSVIPDPVKTILEAERVLKPGGRITVYDKFVKPYKQASFLRKFFNLFTSVLFSNITCRFETILSHTSLKVLSDHKANLGGNFRIILLEK